MKIAHNYGYNSENTAKEHRLVLLNLKPNLDSTLLLHYSQADYNIINTLDIK